MNDYLQALGLLRMVPGKQLISAVSYGIFRILAATVWPYFLYRYLKSNELPDTSVIVFGVLGIVMIIACSGFASYRQSAINIELLSTFSFNLTQRIWKKMNGLDWLTFHSKSRVYYFDMMMVEAWRLRGGMGALLEVLVVNSIIAGALIIFIGFVSPTLFSVFLGALVLLGGLHYYSMRRQRPYIRNFHSAWRTQHQWVSKSVDQFDLIKMGRGYTQSANQHRDQTNSFLKSNADKLRQQSQWRIINQLASNIVRVIIFLLGIYWLQEGYIILSELLIVLLLISIVQSNLMQIPWALNQFMEGQDAALSLSSFFDLKEEHIEQARHAGLQTISRISAKGMSYRYNGKTGLEARDIDLVRGKVYLWQGRNGSGKSTAAHVLLGLLEPQKGHLYINNERVEWSALKTLRPQFAFLGQDSPIFMGGIKENAVFGHPQPDHAWAKLETSWLANLLPAGTLLTDRPIGERGEGLSGGEIKRITLLRELLRSYEVLILDEPLNHLDEYVISTLKQEIVQLKKNAIIIIISHQPGFETLADEIISF